jgi:diguanylate cyclase (GGDEF)-like protein
MTAQGPTDADGRFRTLFEHAPMGMALATVDGTLVEANVAFHRIREDAGVPADAPLDALAGVVTVAPRGRGWLEALADVRAGHRSQARAELPVPGPAGGPRWVAVTTVRLEVDGRAHLLTHVEDCTDRWAEQERLSRLALHDGLTGLANRVLLRDRLEDALARSRRSGVPVGVLYLDLDRFKHVNDTLGHETGDALLVAVAGRVAGALRAGDTAARLGGDEFVVVAGDVGHGSALDELARRVGECLSRPLAVPGRQIRVRASIGAVLSIPGEGAADLLARADAAMFEVKRSRRGGARGGLRRTRLQLVREPGVGVPAPR